VATIPLVLYDDLARGAYRITLLYRSVPSGSVGSLHGPNLRSAHAQTTLLAFGPGPRPHLSEARIIAIATAAATHADDPQPTLIQHSAGTRFQANLVDSGDLVFDYRWSYLIAEQGRFAFGNIGPPPGEGELTGSVITQVVDASTGQVTDAGISNRFPKLAKL